MFTDMCERAKYLEQLFAFSVGEISEVYGYRQEVHVSMPFPPGAWYHPQYATVDIAKNLPGMRDQVLCWLLEHHQVRHMSIARDLELQGLLRGRACALLLGEHLDVALGLVLPNLRL